MKCLTHKIDSDGIFEGIIYYTPSTCDGDNKNNVEGASLKIITKKEKLTIIDHRINKDFFYNLDYFKNIINTINSEKFSNLHLLDFIKKHNNLLNVSKEFDRLCRLKDLIEDEFDIEVKMLRTKIRELFDNI